MMMPTLETEEVYDVIKMQALANELSSHDCRDRIIALRIGKRSHERGVSATATGSDPL